MDSKTFFENFETIVNAPGGIARLRELILDLALSGRLVRQELMVTDSVDVPAESCSDNKSTLSLPKPNGQVTPREELSTDFPYRVPKNWRLIRIDDSGTYTNGAAFKSSEHGEVGIPIIRIQNLTNPNAPFNFAGKEVKPSNIAVSGDILVSWSATLDAFIWSGPKAAVNQHIFKVEPNEELFDRTFLYFCLRWSIRRLAASDALHGSAMKHVNRGVFISSVIPLPPKVEQKQIVTKVHELTTLCDQLEAAQQQRDSLRTSARNSAIDSISTASTAEELSAAWKRINQNWTTFADTPESISSLRSLILDLAVNGKLAPVWNEKIKSQSQKVELGRVLSLEYGKPLEKELRKPNGVIPVFGANGVKTTTDKALVVESGIVVGRKGSAGEVNLTEGPFWPLDVTFYAKFEKNSFDLKYLYYLLKSLQLPKMARGIKPGINRNDVNKLEVLLFGVEEQKRIVAKIDELMALCDQIEAELTRRRSLEESIARSLTSSLLGNE